MIFRQQQHDDIRQRSFATFCLSPNRQQKALATATVRRSHPEMRRGIRRRTIARQYACSPRKRMHAKAGRRTSSPTDRPERQRQFDDTPHRPVSPRAAKRIFANRSSSAFPRPMQQSLRPISCASVSPAWAKRSLNAQQIARND